MRIVLFSVIGLCLAFLNIVVVLRGLGDPSAGDLFLASTAINQFYNAIVVTMAFNVFVPYLAGLAIADRDMLVGWLMRRILLVTLLVFVVLQLCAHWWVPTLFFGLSPQAADQLVPLARIAICALPVHAIQHILITCLRAKGNHVRGEAAVALGELVSVLFTFLLVSELGTQGAALSLPVRAAMITAVLVASAPLCGLRGMPSSQQRAELWRRLRPIAWGSSVYKSTVVVDKMAASVCIPGTIAALTVIQQAISAVEQILSRAFVAPATRDTAALLAGQHRHTYTQLSRDIGWRALPLLVLVLGVWLISVVAPQIFVAVVTLTGVDAAAIVTLAPIILLQPVVSTINGLLNSLHYGSGQVVSPIVVGVIATLVGVMLRLTLASWFDAMGLAVAIIFTHLMVFAVSLPLYLRLRKKIVSE